MNNTKKVLIISIGIVVLIACISLVSYGYVYTKTLGNSDVKNTTFISQSLKVLFSDGSESIISDYGNNFIPGTTISKTFTLTNIGNNNVSFSIDLSNVSNTFTRKEDIVYEVSESNTVIGSGIFPDSDGTIVLGDSLNIGQSKTYTLTINYLNTEDNQIVDSGATIGGKITFGERANSLYKLNIYGNSIQKGTPSPTNPVEVVSLGKKTTNLFNFEKAKGQTSVTGDTFLDLTNKSMFLSKDANLYVIGQSYTGTPTAFNKFNEVINITEPDYYCLKVKVNSSEENITTRARWGFNVTGTGAIAPTLITQTYKDGYLFVKYQVTAEILESLKNNAETFRLYMYAFRKNNTQENVDVTISDIMFVKGDYTFDTMPDYDPYGKYEIPLSIESTKNLFSFNTRSVRSFGTYSNTTKRDFIEDSIYPKVSSNNYTMSSMALSYEIINDNSIKLINSATSSGLLPYGIAVNFKVTPNSEYSISAEYDDSKGLITAGFYDQSGNYIKNNQSISSFVTPDNCYWINVIFRATNFNEEVIFNNIQFEKGSVASTYEPYQYSYVKSIYLDEPLRGVGTCETCADYVDLSTGKIVRNITKQYLNNFNYTIQNQTVTGGNRVGYFSTTLSNIAMKKGSALGGLSNVLTANNGEWASMRSENIRFGQNNTALYIYASNTYATKDELLNYLGNGDPTVPYVYYQLTTPKTEYVETISTGEFIGKKVVVCDENGVCASRVEQI